MQQMTVQDLAERLKTKDAPTLIDVREPREFVYAHIEGAVLKPLGEIYQWSSELNKEQFYVLMCHTGGRSFQAAIFLERMGFKQVANLLGGIDDWSDRIDPTVPKY